MSQSNGENNNSNDPYRFLAIHRVQKDLEDGLVTEAQLEELIKARRMIASRVSTVVSEQNDPLKTTIVNFQQACNWLKKANFDLEKERNKAVKQHSEWGLIDALKAKDMVLNEDQYREIFDKVTFTMGGLNDFVLALNRGEDWMPVFNPGGLSRLELLQLITKRKGKGIGYPVDDDTGPFHEIESQKMLDFINGPGGWEANIPEFQKWFDQEQQQKSVPKIIFTKNQRNTEINNVSVVHCLKQAVSGVEFIDPVSDLIRWRTQFDAKNPWLFSKFPNHKVGVIYPRFVNRNGAFLFFVCWAANEKNIGYQWVGFRKVSPEKGPRIVLC